MTSFRYRSRNRFLRTFEAWNVAHGHDLPFVLKLVLRRAHYLEYRLSGVHPSLVVAVLPQEVRIKVVREGRVWDILACFEAVARRDHEGYRCALCLDPETVWPTREAMWIAHCFEPLRGWMQTSLLPADWLTLDGVAGGTTWAALIGKDIAAPTVRFRLPLHSR